jgi:hypothetical protein
MPRCALAEHHVVWRHPRTPHGPLPARCVMVYLWRRRRTDRRLKRLFGCANNGFEYAEYLRVPPFPYCIVTLLVTEVGERLIGLGHTVRIFTLLNRVAFVTRCVH